MKRPEIEKHLDTQPEPPAEQQCYQTIFVRGDHRYLVKFNAQTIVPAMTVVKQWVLNPDLNLTWDDAYVIAQSAGMAVYGGPDGE